MVRLHKKKQMNDDYKYQRKCEGGNVKDNVSEIKARDHFHNGLTSEGF